MENFVVRLASLTLKNIKNVKSGTIFMPKTKENAKVLRGSEILGIYGQNGSGKTAVVDALYFLQQIMVGNSIEQDIINYINAESDTAEISAEFKIYGDEILYEVGYHICLLRNDGKVVIQHEYLNCAINYNGKRTNKNVFMDYNKDESTTVFKPNKRFEELVGNNIETKLDMIVAKKMAEKSNCSYIFGESSREIFCKHIESDFTKYSIIINKLFEFALKELFIIRNTHSGMITANFLLPMAFRVENEEMGVKGDFAMPLMEPVILDNEEKKLLYSIVEQINTVLYTIIPGMSIILKEYGEQTSDSGEVGWKVELLSMRDNQKALPIRMES